MLIFNATAGQQVFVNVTNNTFSSGSTRLEGAPAAVPARRVAARR
jgi:hypothetical protein